MFWPVLSDLSRLASQDSPLRRPVQIDLSCLSCPSGPVPDVLSGMSCYGCPFLVVLSLLSCSGRPVLYRLSWLYYPDGPAVLSRRPVMAVLPRLTCPSCAAPALLSPINGPRCPVLAVISLTSCPLCPVQAACHADLSRLACPACRAPLSNRLSRPRCYSGVIILI